MNMGTWLFAFVCAEMSFLEHRVAKGRKTGWCSSALAAPCPLFLGESKASLGRPQESQKPVLCRVIVHILWNIGTREIKRNVQ